MYVRLLVHFRLHVVLSLFFYTHCGSSFSIVFAFVTVWAINVLVSYVYYIFFFSYTLKLSIIFKKKRNIAKCDVVQVK